MSEESNSSTNIKFTRRPWLAALLGLIAPPLGHAYTGRFQRGFEIWIIAQIMLIVLGYMLLIVLPWGRIGLIAFAVFGLTYWLFFTVDPYRIAKRKAVTSPMGYQRWWILLLLYFPILAASYLPAIGYRNYLAEAFVVPGDAMAPTIRSGDRILVDKLRTDPSQLRRGDVVVFASEGPGSAIYVMRVIGLPGDKVEIDEERVLINNQEIDVAHAVFTGSVPPGFREQIYNYGPRTIPLDSFFVLGDNRRRSRDSRFLGAIPLSDFHAKARLIFWSREVKAANPRDPEQVQYGPIRWDRIGSRLD